MKRKYIKCKHDKCKRKALENGFCSKCVQLNTKDCNFCSYSKRKLLMFDKDNSFRMMNKEEQFNFLQPAGNLSNKFKEGIKLLIGFLFCNLIIFAGFYTIIKNRSLEIIIIGMIGVIVFEYALTKLWSLYFWSYKNGWNWK